jgi:hypothetical protein
MVRGGDQSVSDKDAMSSQLVLIDHRLETGVEQGRGASPVTSSILLLMRHGSPPSTESKAS